MKNPLFLILLLFSIISSSCNRIPRNYYTEDDYPFDPEDPYPVLAYYYVSLSGDDADSGTVGEPWRSIQHAARYATPGSVVYVEAGRYYEKIAIQVSGNEADGYITFQPLPGHRVIIDGSQSSSPSGTFGDNIIYLERRNYITI